MKKKIIVATMVAIYFILIMFFVIILCNASEFNIFNVEGASEIYIAIYSAIIVSFFTTPFVIVFFAVMLKK
ncbi:hypothetical protein EAP22_07895 [Salmonella enterica]|uniref:hypothetical protein n=1 Tax=Klebsiella pneumoniae TaxID=573 RepID=UPI00073C5FB5|nr:hypothetical protein [Salmonella enterica subsp. enterica serovar Bredeney]EAA8253665.1 hypothetical protein [Salmonella enterica]KSX37242.1 hypothetical protein APT85_15435 [Klebsiella pneumoniae]HBK8461257.1 hypothetical protein [Salmonella enterica subsp. enterica serovar Heidelberg]EAB6789664.1 hypothetical protein [Salmonella enterica subsp. enterica serovar Bredeney]